MNRRSFLSAAQGCAAHLAALPMLPRLWRSLPMARGTGRSGVAPWGRYEEVAPGMWAVISTPDPADRNGPAWRTLCNGGIITGCERVLLIESFASAEGAGWIADLAQELTGLEPALALVTHFHGDHCGGLAALAAPPRGARLLATARTRELLQGREPLPHADLSAGEPTTIDLGGVTVIVTPRDGHTASDVTVHVADHPVVWCGDLVWNGMVPNFRDAIPSRLSRTVRALRQSEPETRFIPGHGGIATHADLDRYQALLDLIESAARAGRARGDDPAAAAGAVQLPAALGEWVMFSPGYLRVAVEAWYREWDATGNP